MVSAAANSNTDKYAATEIRNQFGLLEEDQPEIPLDAVKIAL